MLQRIRALFGSAAAEAPDDSAAVAPELPPLEARATDTLRACHAAGLAARALRDAYRARGGSVVEAVMDGQPHEAWRIYPRKGGVNDPLAQSQYFYHSHPKAPEHGHFHLFCHPDGRLAHLGAIAMDHDGDPIRLFTTNRWVTDEVPLPADTLAPWLIRFRIERGDVDPRVGAWLRHLLGLFAPELAALLQARDRCYADYRSLHGGAEPYEDRALEVTSALAVRLDDHVDQLAAELRRRGAL